MTRRPRIDRAMEALVRQGLVIDARQGAGSARSYLVAQGVPRHVIARVLSEPVQRRDGDRFAVEAAAQPPLPMVRTRAPRHAH